MAGLILVCVSALFFSGLVGITKAKCAGRKGPGLFQPLRDLRLLFQKGSVIGEGTSLVFRLAPLVSFASLFISALLIPFPGHESLFAFPGDFVLFAYLMALGRFAMVAGALDTGSSFEGMGASRDLLYALLAEPAFFILMGSLSLFSGSLSFSGITSHIFLNTPYSYIAAFLAVYLLVNISMIENSRLPVDDPKTHLELTMKHEVMVLDYSGFDLGLIQASNLLRFAIYGGLIANLLIPSHWPVGITLPLYLLVQGALAITVGLLEAFRPRNRMSSNPQFILTLSSVALLAFLLALIARSTP